MIMDSFLGSALIKHINSVLSLTLKGPGNSGLNVIPGWAVFTPSDH